MRLAGVLGIALGWLGWGTLLVGVYAGFLLGGILGGLLSVLRIVERKGFPFGPFMLLGALVGALGEPVWSALARGEPVRRHGRAGELASSLARPSAPRCRGWASSPPWETGAHAALAHRGGVPRPLLWSRSSRGCPPTCR